MKVVIAMKPSAKWMVSDSHADINGLAISLVHKYSSVNYHYSIQYRISI